ncbi:proteophosphoglycan ppg4 [Fusarium mexicanum]|uniref:Proteophosphoglycan ppg4 n=1 Tax=Fusarium mexicanum TaxID=751941 RepID=A0A8H5I987_9HYPO|nr:proteophosphoglycan ppg4 [Fusarium mexicanum]
MVVKLAEALKLAELSWRSNYTTGDKRWGLKQLHGLHQLLMNNRDDIIATLSTSVPSHVHEHEFAYLITEIAGHISRFDQDGHGTAISLLPPSGLDVAYRPVGRMAIVAGNVNPLRWVLGPLAASLAAGNVTVVCLDSHNKLFTSLLSREWTRYLDRDSTFLSTSLALPQLDLNKVNKVLILDPKVQFIDTVNTGLNAALITPGSKSWDQIKVQIERASEFEYSDRLHVVFVRQEEAGVVRSKLECSTSSVLLDALIGGKPGTGLASCVESSKREGSVLLVAVRSLESATDALINLTTPIKQLSILGPHGSDVLDFVRRWVPARLVSVGTICPPTTPGKATSVPDNTAIIRASYMNLVKPLKPEPRGERIGFFDQVDYMIKGTGAVLGMLAISGLYIGLRRLQ